MNKGNIKKAKRTRRHAKIRTQISGTAVKPRLAIFKSNKYISAQIIDDVKAVTLASAHSKDVKGKKTMAERSALVGQAIAEKALEKKIKTVVFDRGGFIYTGCVKALADGARSAGLEF
ncbi:MAG: 50S ribosomal protein L18 [Nitrospira sp.]